QIIVHMVIKLIVVIIQEPVESSHFIWAVVGTVPGSNTSVIGHVVLALTPMGSCGNRADRLTWCMVAVLAHYRLERHLGIGRWIFHFSKYAQGPLIPEQVIKFFCFGIILGKGIFRRVIPIYTPPVHIPRCSNFRLPCDRYIVLCMTCYNAGPTTCTGIQIYGQ